jgi:hypothetical protein
MAKCPVCAQDVAIPFFLNADAWRWLVCPHCAARLERKNPRLLAPLMSFNLALIALSRLGRWYTLVAEVAMVAIIVVMIAELMRQQLQVRKPLPKPKVTLKINDSPN